MFGRLAAMLVIAVLASHVLVIMMLFRSPNAPWAPPPPPQAGTDWVPPPDARQAPPREPPDLLLSGGFWLDVSIRMTALLVVAWFGARWLAAPVRRLAQGAQALGENIERAPMDVSGTQECRDAARVLNQMQVRIRSQMAERDRFLAAVSHDLRTPLTRLRLRLESVEPGALADGLRRDLNEMEGLVRATLDYLHGSATDESLVMVDIESLVRSLADDRLDMGEDVVVHGGAMPLPAQPRQLRRCLDNLVSNAIRYGQRAEFTLADEPSRLVIEVRDHGPGLPAAELTRVLEPFYRVEASRNRGHGGVGLGLSIAREVVRRHGGSLVLRNHPEGGLVATVTLPRNPA